MQKVVDQITDQLVGLIKKDQVAYTPQMLLKAGIPNYIVERVRLVLEDKVITGLEKPTSKWIDPENELLMHAWEDLKSTAFSASLIPHEELYNILHQTIGDIIAVFIEPRKNMASYLFREESVLSFDEMSRRCARLTIYKHFGTAIPLYMKKRELSELSLERCQKLISNLDARIVANYSAEDWAQKLELLFTLFGGKLDPDLLSLFFKDKGFDNAAKMFSSIDVAVTQSTFIEMLSAEQMSKPKEVVSDIKVEKEPVSKEEPIERNEEEKDEVNLASAFQSEEVDPEMNTILGDITDEGLEEESNLEEAQSLNALFVRDEEDEVSKFESSQSKEEEQKELRTNLSSLLGDAKNSFEGVVNEEAEPDELIVEDDFIEDPVEEEESIVPEEKDAELETSEDEEEGEEKPMWAQFLSEDQMEVMMSTREEEHEEPSINDSLLVEDEDDELIIEAPETIINEVPLKGYLHEKESEWIQALFNGKNKEYHSAISDIESLENWDKASKYVESNIFAKENVDMFSEEAIGFIDTLQTYFKEYKS
jgi:hypothetical protein